MSERPQKIEIFNLTLRSDRKKCHLVKWRVDGVDGSVGFEHKTVAQRYRDALDRAKRDGERFDPTTLLPASWKTLETPSVAEWCKRYMVKNIPSYAPRTRKAMGDDLVPLIVRSVPEQAPALGDEQYRSIFDWLAGKSEPSAETAAWLERWSTKLHELDRSMLYRIVGQLKLRADLRSPLAESTASKRITNVKTVLNEAINEGVIAQFDWPPRKTGAKRRSERPRKSVATTMRKKSVETPATLFAIIEASTNHKWISNRYRGMTAVAGLAGLRPSEVFYLDFEDLQLPDDNGVGQILVRDSDVRTEERWMIEEDTHEEGLVKTVESARAVPIPPRLVEELRRWIAIRGITSGPLFRDFGFQRGVIVASNVQSGLPA